MDRHELIRKHMPMARAKARRYQGLGLGLDDLIGQAYLGLCDAAVDYDFPQHRCSFATFSALRIRRFIIEALAKARIFHGPRSIERATVDIANARESLYVAGVSNPSIQAIAEKAGLAEEVVREVLNLVPSEHAIESLGIMPDLPDLDLPELWKQVDQILDLCGKLGKRVLMLVKGFDGPPMSLDETAKELGISRRKATHLRDQSCLIVAREIRRRGWSETSWAAAIAS